MTSVEAPPAGRYRLEPDISEIALSTKHMFGLANVRGRLSILSGELVVSDDPAASRVNVTASAASFDSGDARRDRAVTAPKFLDVQQYPIMQFVSTAVTADNEQWVVAGVLTAHGVEAPLQWVVTDVEQDETGLTLHATGRVDRLEHGITAMRGMAGRFMDLRVTARASRQTTTDTD